MEAVHFTHASKDNSLFVKVRLLGGQYDNAEFGINQSSAWPLSPSVGLKRFFLIPPLLPRSRNLAFRLIHEQVRKSIHLPPQCKESNDGSGVPTITRVD